MLISYNLFLIGILLCRLYNFGILLSLSDRIPKLYFCFVERYLIPIYNDAILTEKRITDCKYFQIAITKIILKNTQKYTLQSNDSLHNTGVIYSKLMS